GGVLGKLGKLAVPDAFRTAADTDLDNKIVHLPKIMTEQTIIVRRDRHQDTEILGVADAAQGVAALIALAHFINMGRRHDHAVARCPELQETHFLAQESLLTFRFHALAAGASESYLELGLLVRIRASLVQRQALETVRLAVRNVVLRLGVDE